MSGTASGTTSAFRQELDSIHSRMKDVTEDDVLAILGVERVEQRTCGAIMTRTYNWGMAELKQGEQFALMQTA